MGAMNEAASVSAQLERVEPDLPVMFERDDMFFAHIAKKGGTPVSNRDVRVPIKIAPGGYFGHYNPDGGSLGRGGAGSLKHATLGTVHLRHAVEYTKKAEWATDSSRKSVLDVVKDLVADAMPDFRRNLDALCMTNGNGVLGTVTSVSTGGGVDTITMSTDGYGIRLVREGMKINIYDSTLTTLRSPGEVEITYYDLENKQIKAAATTGITAGDLVVISGVTGASPVSLFGVNYHHSNASTGTWLGLARATYPQVRCSRVNAASSALALPFARLAGNKAGNRLGMKKKNKCMVWAHPAQEAAYEELGQLVTILDKSAMSKAGLDLYYSGAKQLAGHTMETHYNWDMTRLDWIDFENWHRIEMKPIGFYTSKNGQKFFQLYSNSDGGVLTSEVFYLCVSMNIYLDNPGAEVYVDNLAVPSGY